MELTEKHLIELRDERRADYVAEAKRELREVSANIGAVKLQGFKLTNKVTTASTFVEAVDVDAAFESFAQFHGATSFATLTCAAFGTPMDKSLFEVAPVYWKSDALRGRFSTEAKALAACTAKGIPGNVHLYLA